MEKTINDEHSREGHRVARVLKEPNFLLDLGLDSRAERGPVRLCAHQVRDHEALRPRRYRRHDHINRRDVPSALDVNEYGREAELLGALRRAYGAKWTTMTHAKLFALFSGPGSFGARLKRGKGYENIAAREDFRTLRTRLLDEVQVEAVQEETLAIFTRKLNACLPTACYRHLPPDNPLLQ